MPAKLAGGTLIISLDLDRSAKPGAESRSLVQFTRQALELLGAYKAVATFALTRVGSLATEQIVADPAAHEIALLLNRPANSSEIQHSQQALLQTQAALALGRCITTLALSRGLQTADVDLARRLGMTALRTCAPAGSRGKQPRRSLLGGLFRALRGVPPQSAAPQAVKHGLVELPATLVAPNSQGRFHGAASLGALMHVVTLVAQQQQTMQLVFDVNALLPASNKALATLEHLLKQAASLRSAGQLHFATAATVAARALTQRRSTPSRSILHRRAA